MDASLTTSVFLHLNLLFFTLFILSIFVLYYLIVHLSLRNPLATTPNAHWSSSFSSFWILCQRYKHIERQVTVEAHRKLGPIVRLGPKDLSISCYDGGIRTIYGGGLEKPHYFKFFENYGLYNPYDTLRGR